MVMVVALVVAVVASAISMVVVLSIAMVIVICSNRKHCLKAAMTCGTYMTIRKTH